MIKIKHKKLCSIIRSILYMMKKGLSKTKPWFELHITNLLLEHQSLSCHPTNIHKTFIAPVEHEFSCSDTPFFNHKRKNNRKSHYDHDHYEFMTINKVKAVFDALNSYEDVGFVEPEKSPLTVLGFGGSRRVRQLRVTDSPFMEDCMEEEDGVQVDKLAEDFIKKFYKELKQEKRREELPLNRRRRCLTGDGFKSDELWWFG